MQWTSRPIYKPKLERLEYLFYPTDRNKDDLGKPILRVISEPSALFEVGRSIYTNISEDIFLDALLLDSHITNCNNTLWSNI